ncbi:uncharacterized protein LOC130744699 [Lotus japonicus]|uniref:uncharacterized protein LOC130744699 n=1 Tax=Lotus japonicus TaxID=34305 RepID=UPI00258F43E1|nr:uncharacterized protein LOC130744699 [Lotus japonicus]
MGGGGLLRNHAGNWVMGFMTHYLEGSPFLENALALCDGLQFAWDRGVRRLVCDSDCQELVTIVADPVRVSFHIHALVLREIRNMLARSKRVEFFWCCRDGNVVANWMVKQGFLLPMIGNRMVEVPPLELEVLLLKNSHWIG